MARPRGKHEPSTYEGRPTVPAEHQRRFDLIRAVIGERITMSEAARELGIARVNMQTAVHRAEAAIASTLMPRTTGPAAKPRREKELEAEVKLLAKRNAKLEEQLQAQDDMLAVAGEIIRSLRGLPPKKSATSSPRSPRSPKEPSSNDEDPEPEPPTTALARIVSRLTTKHRASARASVLLGVDPRTLRRWATRLANGEPLQRRRGGRMATLSVETEQALREQVRALGGMVGADSLMHTVVGVSRRNAKRVKDEVVTELERERVAACNRVTVTRPGAIRGFDQMYLDDRVALISADASIPFRTSRSYTSDVRGP
jgi:transposase-like protein